MQLKLECKWFSLPSAGRDWVLLVPLWRGTTQADELAAADELAEERGAWRVRVCRYSCNKYGYVRTVGGERRLEPQNLLLEIFVLRNFN